MALEFYSHDWLVHRSLMIRVLLVVYCYGIRSERRLCQEIELHMAYRWFCKVDLDDAIPLHSTFSANRLGRLCVGTVVSVDAQAARTGTSINSFPSATTLSNPFAISADSCDNIGQKLTLRAYRHISAFPSISDKLECLRTRTYVFVRST